MATQNQGITISPYSSHLPHLKRRRCRIVRVYPIMGLLSCCDVMWLILAYLDDVDLCSFLQTNKVCHRLGHNEKRAERFWELRIKQRYPDRGEDQHEVYRSYISPYQYYITIPYISRVEILDQERIIDPITREKYFIVSLLDATYYTGMFINTLIDKNRLDLIKATLIRSSFRKKHLHPGWIYSILNGSTRDYLLVGTT